MSTSTVANDALDSFLRDPNPITLTCLIWADENANRSGTSLLCDIRVKELIATNHELREVVEELILD